MGLKKLAMDEKHLVRPQAHLNKGKGASAKATPAVEVVVQ